MSRIRTPRASRPPMTATGMIQARGFSPPSSPPPHSVHVTKSSNHNYYREQYEPPEPGDCRVHLPHNAAALVCCIYSRTVSLLSLYTHAWPLASVPGLPCSVRVLITRTRLHNLHCTSVILH